MTIKSQMIILMLIIKLDQKLKLKNQARKLFLIISSIYLLNNSMALMKMLLLIETLMICNHKGTKYQLRKVKLKVNTK